MIEIDPYNASFKQSCLAIFRGNADRYFAEWEYDQFEAFLNRCDENTAYFVALSGAEVVGCGGYEREGDGVVLTWGMVSRDKHGQGIGKALLIHRLRQIAAEQGDVPVFIETSQHTQGFFEKFGFAVTKVEKDGYRQSLDKVHMVRRPSIAG